MALSTAKFGVASTVTAGVGVVGTYFAWDRITLYAVEREVISEEVKLKVESPVNENKKSIKISVDTDNSNPKLKSGSWTCVITSTSDIDTLKTRIQSHLQNTGATSKEQYETNRKLLVKACSKIRSGTPKDNSVEGSLTLKSSTESLSKFMFEGNSDLDFLLENALYEVEKKVVDGEVGLTVEDASENSSKKVKAKASGNDWDENGDGKYYWECVIKLPSGMSSSSPSLETWKGKLFQNESGISTDKQNLKNNEKLVRKCSEIRGASNNNLPKKVKATLDLSTKSEINDENKLFEAVFGKQ